MSPAPLTWPWLRLGWSFLSGIPEPWRRERVLVPIQVLVDDSGTSGTHPVIVLAGLIAPAIVWADFADAWNAVLNEPPAVRSFKMDDAVGPNKSWRRLSVEERNDKLYKLARLISRHHVSAIHCTTVVKDFNDSVRETLPKPFSDPHFLPFHIIIMSSCYELLTRGQARRFEILFDEHKIYAPRVTRWYPVIRELIGAMNQQAYDILPAQPIFRADDAETGLQAADMLAWFFRRRAPSAEPSDDAFDWLLPTLRTVPVSEFSVTFVGNQWRARFDDLYPDSVIEKYAAFYDELFGA